MLVRNTSARLITVNIPGSSSIKIPCGEQPATELPEAAHDIPFVKHLFKSGVLMEVAPRSVDVVEDVIDDEDEELAQLQAEALTLGMEFKDSWKASTLKRKIAEFKGE
ncbi:hypothetical protein VchM-138_0038 [Vibrio phage vB_VchM-138]|uniref:hypothetical protein n=1 Tax=Vibrio phage vB_VchM-138 TaxID=1127518 RepID=UPI0002536E15|nr:hypothetical protein F397_gp38 [Vibrio phage vB_VchM-138]AFC22717.1 hypothetical protein VchM-138_0038 [Vibrio phage vB_VchM-138]